MKSNLKTSAQKQLFTPAALQTPSSGGEASWATLLSSGRIVYQVAACCEVYFSAPRQSLFIAFSSCHDSACLDDVGISGFSTCNTLYKWTPYGVTKCMICKQQVHQDGKYCHTCAYTKGIE
ncbi:hypothetical protein LINGRAHAP2_LOCUS28018 [Linum grandiflorum]